MAKLTRTMTGTAYPKKWTYSTWIKRSGTAEDYIFYATDGGGTNKTHVTFSAAGNFRIYNTISSSTSNNLITNRVFRDTAAWYHIVIIWDTANGTPADRIRLYVNGVRETSFSTETLNDENGTINTAVEHQISGYATSSYIDGVMAHTHFCDNQTYDASYFGETDATSGIWIAKTSPSVTYGDNGFFLKYASGAHGTDSSGESNDFTTSGTLTNTKDTPDNSFATLNLLDGNIINSGGLQNGGTTYNKSSTGSDHNTTTLSTQGVSTGKWYWEVKATNATDGILGFINSNHGAYDSNNQLFGVDDNSYGWRVNGTKYVGSSQTASFFNTYTDDDILSFAIDLDNGKCYAAKNGVWENSGDPTSGATGTGSFADPTLGLFYSPAVGNMNYTSATKFEVNYGNGYFGTTSAGATNADDAGEGVFKYDVPAGYYALCTNYLATYG